MYPPGQATVRSNIRAKLSSAAANYGTVEGNSVMINGVYPFRAHCRWDNGKNGSPATLLIKVY